MKRRYIVDTNVLVAASAAVLQSSRAMNATPQDPALRFKIWQWLSAFEASSSRLVLDTAGKIAQEYDNNLDFNDYGTQVVLQKWSTVAVDSVEVHYDQDGHGILQPPLDKVVHDLADRKMVAAALAALKLEGDSAIVFAGDTDWHDWEQALIGAGLSLEPIIEEWSRAKHAEKVKK